MKQPVNRHGITPPFTMNDKGYSCVNIEGMKVRNLVAVRPATSEETEITFGNCTRQQAWIIKCTECGKERVVRGYVYARGEIAACKH